MSPDERLNILLILTDQQRYDTLGCYDAETCRTPHLDALAQRGVRFSSAYTAAVACSPSRAMLFTGLYPHKNHVESNNQTLNPEIPNLAGELRRAGYNLGYAGKWHLDNSRVASQYGFEGKDFPGYGYPPAGGVIEGLHYHRGRVTNGVSNITTHYEDYLASHGLEPPELLKASYGEGPNRRIKRHEIYALHSGTIDHSFEAMVSEEAVRLLGALKERREKENKPFFLWVNYWGPHTPCLVPEPYYSMYDPAEIAIEPSFPETWYRKPSHQKITERAWGLSGNGWEGWREIVARYWGYVTMLDALIGRVLNEARRLGLMENTLVIFSSDHGDMMGAHRLIEKGPFGYEESFRLPFVAAHPHCETPGSVRGEFVYLQDLFPTFLEMAGITPPEECDTKSILENIVGRDDTLERHSVLERDSVYGYSGHGLPTSLRMVRTREHKLVLTPSERGVIHDLLNDPWETLELYDVAHDPYEMHNLIGLPETRDAQEEMMERMAQYMSRLDDPLQDYVQHIREEGR
ncbi:MAG: sulfatase-like hydrolase/transferase [Anaerolineales bacterium]